MLTEFPLQTAWSFRLAPRSITRSCSSVKEITYIKEMSTTATMPPPPPGKSRQKKTRVLIAVSVVVILVAAGTATLLLRSGDSKRQQHFAEMVEIIESFEAATEEQVDGFSTFGKTSTTTTTILFHRLCLRQQLTKRLLQSTCSMKRFIRLAPDSLISVTLLERRSRL